MMTLNAIRHDLFGGLTSAVVALPLALAFGLASGLGPTAGLYGAIILGFVAAAIGGAPLQISGPTGPMTVVIAGLVIKYAATPEIIIMIILLSGIIQALFGVFRLGAYVNYVPMPVISGFMTGIGCIIILMETLPILGDYSTYNGLTRIIEAIPAAAAGLDKKSLFLGLLTFAIATFFPKKLSKYIPSSLVALIIGSLLAVFYFPDVKTIGAISAAFPSISIPVLSFHDLPMILTSAFMLALLGSIDTLLTATVADKLTKQNHDSDKELIGQGIGNSLTGLFGGIPGAGATMRTVVNIKAGGKTRLSGMMHSVFLIVFVTLMNDVAEKIPQCVLAGLLLKVGIDIIDWDFLKKIKVYPKEKIFLMFTVLIFTVFADLVTAIGLGLILSHMIYSKKMNKNQLSQIQYFEETGQGPDAAQGAIETIGKTSNSIKIKLTGHLNYSVTKDLMSLLNKSLLNHNAVYLNITETQSLDLSIVSALEGFFETLADKSIIHIEVKQGEINDMLSSIGLYDHINPENIHMI